MKLYRVSYICQLTPLTPDLLDDYLSERLVKSGHTNGRVFHRKAKQLIWDVSQGIPRVVNVLAYKAMLAAFVREDYKVSLKDVKQAVQESASQLIAVRANGAMESVSVEDHRSGFWQWRNMLLLAVVIVLLIGLGVWLSRYPL